MNDKNDIKICGNCKIKFPTTTKYFYKDKLGKFGLKSWCKKCMSRYGKNYKEENKSKISEYNKTYYKDNREILLNKTKRYYKTKHGMEVRRKSIKNHYKRNKIYYSISRRIRQSLKSNKNGHHWEDLVGYTLEELKQHLEFLFQDGMTWNNHGEWHIDHIKPISSFNITDYECEDFKECWCLENLQPLWAEDNLRKGAKC